MMKKIILLTYLVIITFVVFSQDDSRERYIDKFKEVAIREMERSGVPASIKLGQGILESNAGQSTLAKKANNHFGIKCGPNWTGKTYYREDDDYDEEGNLIKSCFRVYKNAGACYAAHSDFLRDPKKAYRYGFLFDLNPTDYKAWARGLKMAGYATSPTYAEKLIRIIEAYELFKFDRGDFKDIPDIILDDETYVDSPIQRINDAKTILSEKGDTPFEIANKTGIAVRCILKFNENLTENNQTIPENTRVYLQNKRNNYRGKKKWHYVKEGETLFHLSQRYGVKESKLRKKNRIEEDREPKTGEAIKLRGWKVCKKNSPKTIKAEEVPDLPEEKLKDEVDFIDDPVGVEETLDVEETFDPFDEELPQPEPVYHIVQSKETLYGISRKYNVSVPQLRQLNNLTSDVIFPGLQLRIK